jgi:hypothetical protein
VLEPTDPPGPPFLLQRVPEAKSGKNRMHVDIRTEDLEAEADRLVVLGGRVVSPEPVEEFGLRWLTLCDPEGNEFDLAAAPRRSLRRRNAQIARTNAAQAEPMARPYHLVA